VQSVYNRYKSTNAPVGLLKVKKKMAEAELMAKCLPTTSTNGENGHHQSAPLTPPPSPKRNPLSQKLSVQRGAVFRVLRELADDNACFFEKGGWSSYISRLADCCREIAITADITEGMLQTVWVKVE
jgi:hypothetical protein